MNSSTVDIEPIITNSQIGKLGLGNQLFQYAVLKRISVEKGYKLVLNSANSGCRLADFEISDYTMMNPENLTAITNVRRAKYFHFDKTILNVPPNTDIRGYFQSEKYFKPVSDIIRKEFTLKDRTITARVRDFIGSIRKDGVQIVSLHLRRGDYLLEKNLKRHPFPGLSYYYKAMNFFRDKSKYLFVILSDDIEWCQENFKFENIEFSPFSKDLEDLALMQACDRNIIANSSFSWWGAWLNNNPRSKDMSYYGVTEKKNVDFEKMEIGHKKPSSFRKLMLYSVLRFFKKLSPKRLLDR